jgi:Zn-dependent protease
MFEPDVIQRALTAAPVILFSLTVHEFAHGWTALRYGDPTARDMGRLTFNPLAHLDLFGSLAFVLSNFTFGWAKPVPVNLMNIRGNVRVADFWISAAGPLSNMGLAFIFGMLFRILGQSLPEPLFLMLHYAVIINIALAFFNLIPVFPLDGSHILRSVMPERYTPFFERIQPFSIIILIGLMFTGATWMILGPFVSFFAGLFAGIGVR